ILDFAHMLCMDSAAHATCTLSLHDALPICSKVLPFAVADGFQTRSSTESTDVVGRQGWADRRFSGMKTASLHGRIHGVSAQPCRSEEHTSELQSRENLVCRLLLEKKNHD